MSKSCLLRRLQLRTEVCQTQPAIGQDERSRWLAGSSFADFLLAEIGCKRELHKKRKTLAALTMMLAYHLPKIYKILEFFGLESGAFSQLTREYMINNFNPKTPDLPGVR